MVVEVGLQIGMVGSIQDYSFHVKYDEKLLQTVKFPIVTNVKCYIHNFNFTITIAS